MILIITHKGDYTADYIINRLNERRIEYRRFNCEDILSLEYQITIDKTVNLSILGCSRFDAVWFRRTKLPEVGSLSSGERAFILQEADSLINNIFELLDAKWISNPRAVYRAENKLLQLKIALEVGFILPSTLLTNSHDHLTAFFAEMDGKAVVKPLAQNRIIEDDAASFIFTNRISANQIKTITQYDLTPSIYQREIEKDYEVRITVVGNEVFSAAVDSQSDTETQVDWRRKKLKFRAVEVPSDVREKCIKLVAALDLSFGAIDMIKTKSDRYIFLEINPNGQWVWIELDTDLAIADALINLLISK